MIIHATSIHSGGGKVLLDQLLLEKKFGPINILICDERYILPIAIDSSTNIYRVKPSLISRWKAEVLLKRLSGSNPKNTVLCFSNLPPAFKLKSNVVLYLQNALLIPGIPLYASSIKVALRLIYERVWSRIFWKNIDEVWVQTEWMKNALSKSGKPVNIKPFLPTLPEATQTKKKYDFITISGTSKHKRLTELLSAWDLFSDRSAPSLLVVTDGTNEKYDKIFQHLESKNVSVKIGASREEIFNYYQVSKALLVTSKLESFCLPIYEAAHFKLKIFGVNEPYSRDSGLLDGYIDLSSAESAKSSIENNFQKFSL